MADDGKLQILPTHTTPPTSPNPANTPRTPAIAVWLIQKNYDEARPGMHDKKQLSFRSCAHATMATWLLAPAETGKGRVDCGLHADASIPSQVIFSQLALLPLAWKGEVECIGQPCWSSGPNQILPLRGLHRQPQAASQARQARLVSGLSPTSQLSCRSVDSQT